MSVLKYIKDTKDTIDLLFNDLNDCSQLDILRINKKTYNNFGPSN